jgi:hypothetical protein
MSNNESVPRPLLYGFLDVDDFSNSEIHILQILGADMRKSMCSRDPVFPKARKKILREGVDSTECFDIHFRAFGMIWWQKKSIYSRSKCLWWRSNRSSIVGDIASGSSRIDWVSTCVVQVRKDNIDDWSSLTATFLRHCIDTCLQKRRLRHDSMGRDSVELMRVRRMFQCCRRFTTIMM